MKIKFNYILTIFLFSFIFVGNVFAGEIIVSSSVENNTVPKGSEVSVKINLKTSEVIKECTFKLENDETIEFVSKSFLVNTWKVSEDGVDGVKIINDSLENNDLTNGQNIGEFKYKVNDNGRVIIKTVECKSETESFNHDDVIVNLTALEDEKDTTLKSLKIINGSMNPADISVNHEGSYIVTLNDSNFGLEMVTSDSEYQDDIVVTDVDGNIINDVTNITFNDPTNQGQIPLTITVFDNTKYNLLVTYTKKDLDNSLSSITINGEQLNLEKGKYDYEYIVDEDVGDIIVAAVIKDIKNFKFGDRSNAPSTFPISDTVSVIIIVEPKDSSSGGEAVVYNIEVTKKKNSSSNGGSINQGTNGSGNTGSNTGNNVNNTNTNTNPGTADMPMVLMACILIVSLMSSVFLYRRNINSYK